MIKPVHVFVYFLLLGCALFRMSDVRYTFEVHNLMMQMMMQIPKARRTQTWDDIVSACYTDEFSLEVFVYLAAQKDCHDLYKKQKK